MAALRHLNAAEVAAEFGRSRDWLHRHWRELVRAKKLPPPVSGGADARDLAWSAAQVYAVLDKDLPPPLKAAAAAYRAAASAYIATHTDPDAGRDEANARARLDRRFSKEKV